MESRDFSGFVNKSLQLFVQNSGHGVAIQRTWVSCAGSQVQQTAKGEATAKSEQVWKTSCFTLKFASKNSL